MWIRCGFKCMTPLNDPETRACVREAHVNAIGASLQVPLWVSMNLCFVHRHRTKKQRWMSWWWQWWDSDCNTPAPLLSRQTSRLRGSFRLQMLCIIAAHAFNTHQFSPPPPRCTLIHTHTLKICKSTTCVTSEQFGLYFDPFKEKKKKSSPDISIKVADQ